MTQRRPTSNPVRRVTAHIRRGAEGVWERERRTDRVDRYASRDGAAVADPVYGIFGLSGNQSIPNLTEQAVDLDTVDESAGGVLALTSGAVSSSADGLWFVSFHMDWAASSTGRRRGRVLQGGTRIAAAMQWPSGSTDFGPPAALVYGVLDLSCVVSQTSGGDLNLNSFGTKLHVAKIA